MIVRTIPECYEDGYLTSRGRPSLYIRHPTCVMLDAEGYQYFLADFTKHYDWIKNNNITGVLHSVMRTPGYQNDYNVGVMFVFNNEEDAMAFKLRWI